MTDETDPIIPPRKGRPPNKLKNLAVDRPPVREPIRSTPTVDMSQWENFELPEEDTNNRLHVPDEHIPDGMDYLWCTDSILGQPQPQWRANRERMGWRPVPAQRHDGMFMPKGYVGEINVDGTVLMERPLEYSIRHRQADIRRANDQVRNKELQIRGGQIDNVSLDTQHPTALRTNKVRKDYDAIPVPKD